MPRNNSTVTTATATAGHPDRGRSLRGSVYAVVLLILIQYGLGMWLNLFATIPQSDQGKGTFAAFGAAVADGPVGLTLHALLGTLLLLAALALLIGAIRARVTATIALSVLGFLAIIGAWVNGAMFVGNGANGSSMGMAMSAGAALLCYISILFVRR
ncbi:MAG: hypothetical protein ACRDNW_14350 [Trebonia sp.]